jgi:hypothetical protein
MPWKEQESISSAKPGDEGSKDWLGAFNFSKRLSANNLAKIPSPEKDWLIFSAAVEAHATHLISSDVRHFGGYFGRIVEGILMCLPRTV